MLSTARVFLGVVGDEFYFANLYVGDECDNYFLVDVKEYSLQGVLAKEKLSIISQALSVLNWHQTHQYCGACGSKTVLTNHGWQRNCLNCNREHFPRVDSVAIMLVTNGEYCLLGAGHNFADKHYSCLAGFMEPGETIEAAAARELYEEAGISGEPAEYLISQPWPFPYSLMIGVHIKTSQHAIVMEKKELRDLIWVHKNEIILALKGDSDMGFYLPPKTALARTLLKYWVAADDEA